MSDAQNQEQADLELLPRPVNQWPKFNNYRPLSGVSQEIRLLKIRHQNNQIHGTIQHMRFDQKIPYEALSYCWGAPADGKPIYIDGQQVLVRNTLWSFLNNLCARKHDLPLWLDAICINQTDPDERNSQVQIMGKIYSRAARTFAWLGDADDESDYALAFLKRSQAEEIQFNNNADAIRHRALKAAEQLMQRSYWSRLWIVQEIGLSKQVFLLCGSRDIDLHTLAEALEAVGRHDKLKPIMDIRTRFNPYARARIELETRKPLTSSSKCLLELMAMFASRRCTEQKDVVFALRSLAIDKDQVEVNYDLSLVDLLLNVIESFLGYKMAHDSYAERSYAYSATDCLRNTVEILSMTLGLIQPPLSQLFQAVLRTESIDALREIYQPVRFLYSDMWTTKATVQSNMYRWNSHGAQSSETFGQKIFNNLDEIRFHETWLSFVTISKQYDYWYTTVTGNEIRPSDALLVATNTGITGGLRIVISLTGPVPIIVGAIDSKNKISSNNVEPPLKTQLWFVLLQAKEIIACRAVLARDEAATEADQPVYNIVVHYSNLALLLLSMPEPDPARVDDLLGSYRAKNPIGSLCRCRVLHNTDRLAWFNNTIRGGSGLPGPFIRSIA